MKRDVIIACDFPSKAETLDFLEKLGDRRPFLKIGMELFYAEGPEIVRELKGRGHKIFLDLKLCDIPNTVRRAMAVLSKLGADMVNVHAFGTSAMMRAAVEGLTRPDGTRPLLIAVTMLTSTSEAAMNTELMIPRSMKETVGGFAMTAAISGLDGVVCSPLEAGEVHKTCGGEFLTVTPGVRFSDGEKGDQSRITTPYGAHLLGSDFIVVGRPITASENPAESYDRCVREFIEGEKA